MGNSSCVTWRLAAGHIEALPSSHRGEGTPHLHGLSVPIPPQFRQFRLPSTGSSEDFFLSMWLHRGESWLLEKLKQGSWLRNSKTAPDPVPWALGAASTNKTYLQNPILCKQIFWKRASGALKMWTQLTWACDTCLLRNKIIWSIKTNLFSPSAINIF